MLFLPRRLPLAILLALLPAPAGAQAEPATPPISWASIAIHVSDPSHEPGSSSGEQPNGMNERGRSLREIISEAYNFSVVTFRDDEISGLPDWARNTRYDIAARVDPEDIEAFKKFTNLSMKDTITAFTARHPTGAMLMMQSLLTDRFHLQVHWEQKERSVYTLSVAKGGVRMKSAADPEHGELSWQQGHLSGKGVPVSFLTSVLALPADRTVIDTSGLTGSYDFDLRYDPADTATAPTPSNDPNLFIAVQEQLGLKLQSTHASVPVLVVDHVEPPTPN